MHDDLNALAACRLTPDDDLFTQPNLSMSVVLDGLRKRVGRRGHCSIAGHRLKECVGIRSLEGRE